MLIQKSMNYFFLNEKCIENNGLTGHPSVCFSAQCLDSGCSATGPPAQVALSAGYCRQSTGPHQRATEPQTLGLCREKCRIYGVKLSPRRLRLIKKSHNWAIMLSASLLIEGKTLYPKKQFHSSPSWVCLHLSGTTAPQYLIDGTH